VLVCTRSVVTVYVQREQFAKFVPRVGHSGVRDVNSYDPFVRSGSNNASRMVYMVFTVAIYLRA